MNHYKFWGLLLLSLPSGLALFFVGVVFVDIVKSIVDVDGWLQAFCFLGATISVLACLVWGYWLLVH